MDLGMSIAWKQVPYQEGGWPDWDWTIPEQQKAYDRLLEPDKRFHVVGDQISYLSGWQEGAVLSAHHVIHQIAGVPRAMPEAVPSTPRPSRRITGARVR
jgi:monoamine oxidase